MESSKSGPLRVTAVAASLLLLGVTLHAANPDWCGPLETPGETSAASAVAQPWETDAGTRTSWGALMDQPAVVALFFSTCHVVCPLTVEKMRDLARVRPESGKVRFILISVDPGHDTAEVLRAFRVENQLGRDFVLLRGSISEVRKVARQLRLGFSMEGPRVTHSGGIVLIGADGNVLARHDGVHSAPKEVEAALGSL